MSISGAESVVMEALWRRSPLTADQIIAQIADKQDWTPATVRTLLNRLLAKKAVSAEREGRSYLYRPLLKRTDYVQAESQDLLDRLFSGRVGPFVTHFSERRKLGRKDIADLKKLIEDLDDGS